MSHAEWCRIFGVIHVHVINGALAEVPLVMSVKSYCPDTTVGQLRLDPILLRSWKMRRHWCRQMRQRLRVWFWANRKSRSTITSSMITCRATSKYDKHNPFRGDFWEFSYMWLQLRRGLVESQSLLVFRLSFLFMIKVPFSIFLLSWFYCFLPNARHNESNYIDNKRCRMKSNVKKCASLATRPNLKCHDGDHSKQVIWTGILLLSRSVFMKKLARVLRFFGWFFTISNPEPAAKQIQQNIKCFVQSNRIKRGVRSSKHFWVSSQHKKAFIVFFFWLEVYSLFEGSDAAMTCMTMFLCKPWP